MTVSVGQPVNNSAPQINSTPQTAATVGSPYSYDVDATDSDNDTLTFSLSSFPSGMSINSSTGAISWTPTASQIGSQAITVKVTDGKNGNDNQSFNVSVTAADQTTVPNLVNQTRTAAEATLQQAKLNVGTLTFQHNTKDDGQIISQSPAANSAATIGAAANLMVSLGPDNGLPPNPVTVAPALDTTVATSTYAASQFLYTGSNPIQTGVQSSAIDAKRVAVVHGSVMDKQNNPLPGAIITIKDHPEFGQTMSRADGQYDMAVNGGGNLIINYTKANFLPVQRQITPG